MGNATGSGLKGRRALVTGGASGIGAAIVRRLAADGAAVAIADLQGELAKQLAVEIGGIAVTLDVTDFEAVHAAIQAHGPFDILVNNAGVDQHAFFTKTTPADWRRLLSINLESVLNTTHAALPAMQAAGYGRIINVASEAGRLGSRGGAVYAAAKGGVIAFTRSIARENGGKGITANVVAPGPIDTPLLQQAVAHGGDKLLAAMTGATLAGRLGTPEEVAATVAFLASQDAGFIAGEAIGVSGGMGCGA
ncbi:3-oxoacyl-ACP reductase [Variovorax sp. WS11]|uniref:SDR family NAD(P)-dependent oxidoreductase n=1 Tax=Variovorax sp. WS11 TaxID=1105204 RepID=UPI000D0DA94A|nr:SDR family oxidoreductase [Variovorax sp. WS11]NDZ18879.1 SDR family oxidoreductase [Variovorax sp. WS11]PSL80048.1 3-oxoacyl-ACP reductase [Variovorax sp. WS11]